MGMKNIYLFLLLSLSFLGFSQTKLIAHKSHSGTNETFAIAYNNHLFDIDNSNLGEFKMDIVDYKTLDSVVLLPNNKVIRYTSEYTQRFYRLTQQKCSADEKARVKIDTISISSKTNKTKLTATEVKKKLDSLEVYKNQSSPIIFKGFNERSKRKKLLMLFSSKFPKNPLSFLIVLLVSLLAFILLKRDKTIRTLS